MVQHLISDLDVTYDLVERYLARGYQPIPVAGPKGKAWQFPRGGGAGFNSLNSAGQLATDDEIRANFRDYSGAGVGIVGEFLRKGQAHTLLHIDVDIRSEEDPHNTITTIANIIGMECPFRVGAKGGNFTVRYVGNKSLHDILVERKLPHKGLVTGTTISFPWLKGKTAHAVDLIGVHHKSSHANMPPMMHLLATAATGQPVYYRWASFPGTDGPPMRLEDTDPRDLPELQEHHLLLMYQWAKNPTSALWTYLFNSAPGDHHQTMLAASFYMHNEMFTPAEIEDICSGEASRTAADESTEASRLREIRDAVRGLKDREQQPAKPGGTSGPKIPLERLMTDWLHAEYPADDVAIFSAIPYHWNGEGWDVLTRSGSIDPWQVLSRRLFRKFDTAAYGQIKSAVFSFAGSIEQRIAQPNQFYVPFANGLLDVRDMMLYVEKRDDYIPARLEHDYNELAEAPLWQAFIRNLMQPPLEYSDEQDQYREDWIKACKVVEEFLGYCLVRSHEFQKMLFLIGKPGTGKSVLTKVFEGLLPPNWTSHVAMDALDESNSRMQMVQANVNIAGEVGRRSRDVDDTLLKVVAGEPVEVKLLYQNRMQAVLPSRLIFHGNLPPDTTDSTGAIERRSLMLRTTDIKPQEVLDYQHKLLEEAPGILLRLVNAYARLQERRGFDLPSYAVEAASNMSKTANTAVAWIEECCVVVEDVEKGGQSHDLFTHYREWCEHGAIKPMNKITWGKMLSADGFPVVRRRLPGNNFAYYRRIKLRTEGAGKVGGY